MVGRVEDKELFFGAKVGMKGEEECPLILWIKRKRLTTICGGGKVK